MIVKVKEPNNCYNSKYVGDTDNEKRFTGRTMYRYYRCMPIYSKNGANWQNTIGNNSKLVGQKDSDMVELQKSGTDTDNPTITPKSIIGFVNFQELLILELSSHQGNVLAYPNYEKRKQEVLNKEWWYNSNKELNKIMNYDDTSIGFSYGLTIINVWDRYINDEKSKTAAMLIKEGKIKMADQYINKDLENFINSGDEKDILNGVLNLPNFSSSSGTPTSKDVGYKLNRYTWVGLHPSTSIKKLSTSNELIQSNMSILSRLLRKFNNVTKNEEKTASYIPSIGGTNDGTPAGEGTWDGKEKGSPVWLPSMINYNKGAMVSIENDKIGTLAAPAPAPAPAPAAAAPAAPAPTPSENAVDDFNADSKMMPFTQIQQKGDTFGECGGYSGTGDYLVVADLQANKF